MLQSVTVPGKYMLFRRLRACSFNLIKAGAARGLLGSRHLVVKITDFTDFHPILRGFQRYLRKLRHYFTPPLNKSLRIKIKILNDIYPNHESLNDHIFNEFSSMSLSSI